MFEKMPQRNVVSYNTLISGFTRHGLNEDSVNLIRVVQNGGNGLVLDEFTLVRVFGSCACLGDIKWLRQVHGVAVIVGMEWNVILNNALIDAYGKCGEPDLSCSVFCWIPERNVVSWTSMVVAYTRSCRLDEACRVFDHMPVKNGRCSEAFDVFKEMLEEAVRPSAPTFVSVLDACAVEALIGRGKQVHGQVIRGDKSGNLFNVYVCNALIDMYGKCGDMKSAKILFEMGPVRDVVTWNTLITGFVQNGNGKESLALFRRMIEDNVEPNHVTFLGVLSSCSHACLDNEGLESVDLMARVYGVKPKADHYALLVDLLGRKNRLKEAMSLIAKCLMKL